MAKRKKEAFDWEEQEQEEIIWVSKSEIKRDAEALKQLGEKLVELTKNKLAKIPLDGTLLDAIELAQRLQKEARRRQLQFIGKLLRNTDVEPIKEALAKIENKDHLQQAALHKIERLREELLTLGEEPLTRFLTEHPNADRQRLRHLIRQAQNEKNQEKPAKAYREVYQYLKELVITSEGNALKIDRTL